MSIIKNLISLLCIGVFFLSTQGRATICIGYYKNLATSSTGDWKTVGDQFSRTKINGIASWGAGKGTSLYKGPKNGVPSGPYSTYSIALPNFITANDTKLNVSIVNEKPHKIATNPNYSSWLISTSHEGCRSLPQDNTWYTIENTRMNAGKISVLLQGDGLQTGHYNLTLPYTIAWGVDSHETEIERTEGPWKEVDPASNTTGVFQITFDVENNCNLKNNELNIKYGDIAANDVNKREIKLQNGVFCKRDTKLSFSLTPETVDLKNGVVAKLKIVDYHNHNIKNLNASSNHLHMFNVVSELEVRNKIKEGDFSGVATLTLNYQ